ncbi:MAG: hypothetical protein Q4B48_01155 [Syntrophomonadaceae bacterium]|nr:hypothetical protein [Syntrophomonadaceae bacterium]
MLTAKYGQIECEYIDTAEQDLSMFPEVEDVVKRGYSFPLTAINGTLRLAGVIAPDAIVEILDEAQ